MTYAYTTNGLVSLWIARYHYPLSHIMASAVVSRAMGVSTLQMLLLLLSRSSFGGTAASITVDVRAIDTSSRTVPLFGYGNELVWQSSNDTKLTEVISRTGSTLARYPGGTPSDYWDWKSGWVNRSADRSGCDQLPERQSTPTQWRQFLRQSAIGDSIIVVCQLTCSLEYEMKGLRAHHAAGTPIRFIGDC